MIRRGLLLIGMIGCLGTAIAQDLLPDRSLDFSPFYGSILLHNPDISHLISAHPSGLILGWNTRTFGDERWEASYGYPDKGISFVYQDMRNPTLGQHFGLYAHYNFYFFRRQLQIRIAQGIAYNTNPYDPETNFRNNAYGTHFLSSTYVMAQYYRERIFGRFGFRAGLALVHYSNANVRAPNTSTNTFGLSAGILYDLGPEEKREFRRWDPEVFREPIRANLAFRSGVNESDVIGSGQFPFYIVSAYADKRLARLSAVHMGVDLFFSNFLKELIRFQSTSFPELDVDPSADYRRVGLFAGHELFIGKLSVIAQLGYYIYYPFDFEGRTYNRIGIKRYFGDKVFGAISLKSHGAKAEALEFGIGIRL